MKKTFETRNYFSFCFWTKHASRVATHLVVVVVVVVVVLVGATLFNRAFVLSFQIVSR